MATSEIEPREQIPTRIGSVLKRDSSEEKSTVKNYGWWYDKKERF
jgi:hypothetical protein